MGDPRVGDGRPVLITGATSGIGLATALRLARSGFRTFGSARSAEKAEQLRSSAGDAGVLVEPIVLDLTDPESGWNVIADLKLWGLVNNAGWANAGRLVDVPITSARRQLEAMVIAPFRLALLALPGMRARRTGRIVNISSPAGRVAGPLLGWYEATKHAVEALTEALRMETTDSGLDVVLIEPGSHGTNIWRKAAQDLEARGPRSDRPGSYERALGILRMLEPRMPEPEHVAGAIEAALTDERPKRRYRVGADAVIMDMAGTFTPGRVRDRVLRRTFKL